MIALRTISPSPALREFVRVYAQREVSGSGVVPDVVTEPIPPRLEQTLEFQFGEPFRVVHWNGDSHQTRPVSLVGAHFKAGTRIELRPGICTLAVFFRPAGFSRLFGIPGFELAQRHYDGTLVSNRISQLWKRLAECRTFPERVRTLESVLHGLAARNPRAGPIVEIAEHIFSRRGTLSISGLAGDAGLGRRQFERNFLQCMGVPPKRYARVARFQSALDTKIAAPHRSWLEIAHDLEYHDQMHMIHDFKQLAGSTPAKLLPAIGDARPVAYMLDKPHESDSAMCHFF
jgi:AraC-like DNA-binding protein